MLDDIPQITEAINSILENKELAEELRHKGRENATRFSWQGAGKRVYAVVREAG